MIAAAVVATACDGTAEAPSPGGRGVVISLGDSVAAGVGASDREATSYAALLARDMGDLELRNLAVPGATTQAVIDDQLDAAIATIGEGRAAFVTISAGGNDFAGLIPNQSCVEDPLPESCPIDNVLRGVDANLDAILSRIRKEGAGTPVVLLAYPNFFSGTGHMFEAPAGRVLPRLGASIRAVAARHERVFVAEAEAAFEGHGGALTHLFDAQPDPHPNDAGHRAIADAFLEAIAAR